MTTQKTFKGRVRARMAKTGEAYTTARAQLLRHAATADAALPAPGQLAAAPEPAPPALPTPDEVAEQSTTTIDPAMLPTSNAAAERATGRPYAAWFADLDAVEAQSMGHARIAAWLVVERGVPGWWAQSITVAYERTRGLRATNQATTGFQASVTRTIRAAGSDVLEAFTDPETRTGWLPSVALSRRPTRAANTARFDWSDPPSRIVVSVATRDDGRTVLSLVHERLPDARAVADLKAFWRDRLDALRRMLEDRGARAS
jgi:uncharacterized protein YndB with AHSA1/START domain